MGNWRTVDMRGSISKADVQSICDELSDQNGWVTPAECLTMGRSICGIDQWVRPDGTIDTSGNLAERDYDNDDIERALTYLAEKYPSLELTLHSGSDWESLECSATFHVKDGVVTRCEPELSTIRGIDPSTMKERLAGFIYGRSDG